MARIQKDHRQAHWRKEHGVSLQALAEDVGCTQSFLSQIELGQKQPSLTMAMKLRQRTGLPLEAYVIEQEAAQ